MKTALQELIEWMREQDSKRILLSDFAIIDKATELLEKEREQIEKACAYGFKDALKPSGSQVLNWKQYYNETFNQKQIR